MGWLELIPLLKRLLPLLSRTAPMLETMLATRTVSRTEADGTLQQMLARMDAQDATQTDRTAGLESLLAAQAGQLQTVSNDLAAARRTAEEQSRRTAAMQRQLQSVEDHLRILAAAILALLLACVVLLVLLLTRRG